MDKPQTIVLQSKSAATVGGKTLTYVNGLYTIKETMASSKPSATHVFPGQNLSVPADKETKPASPSQSFGRTSIPTCVLDMRSELNTVQTELRNSMQAYSMHTHRLKVVSKHLYTTPEDVAATEKLCVVLQKKVTDLQAKQATLIKGVRDGLVEIGSKMPITKVTKSDIGNNANIYKARSSRSNSSSGNDNPAKAKTATVPPTIVKLASSKHSGVNYSTVKASTVNSNTFKASTVNPSTVKASTVNSSTFKASTINPSTVKASTVNSKTVKSSTITSPHANLVIVTQAVGTPAASESIRMKPVVNRAHSTTCSSSSADAPTVSYTSTKPANGGSIAPPAFQQENGVIRTVVAPLPFLSTSVADKNILCSFPLSADLKESQPTSSHASPSIPPPKLIRSPENRLSTSKALPNRILVSTEHNENDIEVAEVTGAPPLATASSSKPHLLSKPVSVSPVPIVANERDAEYSSVQSAHLKAIEKVGAAKPPIEDEEQRFNFMTSLDLVTPKTLELLKQKKSERKRITRSRHELASASQLKRCNEFLAPSYTAKRPRRSVRTSTPPRKTPSTPPLSAPLNAAPPSLTSQKTNSQTPSLNASLSDDDGSLHEDFCAICSRSGQLLLCDTCTQVYHLGCIGLESVPKGKWSCPKCIGPLDCKPSKNKSGMSAISAVHQFVQTKAVKDEERSKLLQRNTELMTETKSLKEMLQNMDKVIEDHIKVREELKHENQNIRNIFQKTVNVVKMIKRLSR
ncbi:PHD finger protein 21A-like [Watersipora subatra]|uniref:PHD finger protein 21A-like n=1 Tax=Watersipora subatra TaxID=2589382 RepID=UPI00355BBEC4